ncbi:SAF domain-containing protein [Arthrobacter mangrovi]|uniref:SAF domain-containing protein n=1 Tax=Arthrobacter mangrovi TaxID=2966350 RepID=A0ABQ5MSG6_9MICC|nr:SAF domain-containing protein [Arthrobacter mangrovi]GLB66908.1 hypothetical protein AHIS1636_13470 [Arthrobacter mangrovi]
MVGILLVLVSVAAVTALLGSADKTVPMLAARDDIGVGEPVRMEDLSVVEVRLGNVERAYLRAQDELPQGAIATALLRRGELIPASALGSPDLLGRKPVSLTIDSPLPEGARAGSRVDVWVAMPDGRNGFSQPELHLEAAEVSELSEASSALGAAESERLHVLVTDEKMPGLLNALSNGAKINVVLNPGRSS